jgi:hypothetical protein
MLKISDKNLFLKIVANAVSQAHQNHPHIKTRNRWIKAIAKAVRILEGDTDFLHRDAEREILYFWSADSNEIYETGETCACPVFRRKKPQPCYHRAMRLLVKNYFKCLQTKGEIPKIDFADAVFFDAELSAREKIELLNLSILEGRIELKTRVATLERFALS